MSDRRTRLMFATFLVFAAAAAGGSAQAAETAGATSRALDAAADARLAQVVPVTLEGEPLARALRTLSDQSGVRLDAAREVADLKVMLRARELPLRRSLQ